MPALIVRSYKETTVELKATVTRLEEAGQIAHGAAELIRESVAHLPDVDSSLYESALLLTRFAETIPALDESALHLRTSPKRFPGWTGQRHSSPSLPNTTMT